MSKKPKITRTEIEQIIMALVHNGPMIGAMQNVIAGNLKGTDGKRVPALGQLCKTPTAQRQLRRLYTALSLAETALAYCADMGIEMVFEDDTRGYEEDDSRWDHVKLTKHEEEMFVSDISELRRYLEHIQAMVNVCGPEMRAKVEASRRLSNWKRINPKQRLTAEEQTRVHCDADGTRWLVPKEAAERLRLVHGLDKVRVQ